jgi:hypothetical protein
LDAVTTPALQNMRKVAIKDLQSTGAAKPMHINSKSAIIYKSGLPSDGSSNGALQS